MAEKVTNLPKPFCLKTGQARKFAWSLVHRYLHIQGASRIAEIFGCEDSAFLADEQGSLD